MPLQIPMEKSANHPMYRMNESIYRLQKEHASLLEGAMELIEESRSLPWDEDETLSLQLIRDMKAKIRSFLQELYIHARWKKDKLFPMLKWRYGDDLQIYGLMKRDYEKAMHRLQTFLGVLDVVQLPVGKIETGAQTDCLIEVYSMLKRHFKEEEGVIHELAANWKE